MPPAKYSTIDAGGVNFQLTQTELKQIKTLVDEMKKLKTLYEAQQKVLKKMGEVRKEIVTGEKKDTQYQRDRLKVLDNIYNRMRSINQQSLETLKKENPYIPRTGATGTSQGRYNYRPEDAEDTANAKGREVQYGSKLIAIYDRLKKSYAYQLFYFSAASILVAGMLANSKVWSHFMDIIGSALGFIMDMLLVSIIPWVVQLVNFLFMVGEAISKLPDWLKQVIFLLGLFVAGLLAIKVYTAIAETLAAIKAIGTAAGVATGAEGVGGLATALKTLSAMSALDIVITASLVGTAAYLLMSLVGHAGGLEQRINAQGLIETRTGKYGQGPEEGWGEGQQGGIQFAQPTGQGGDTVVNVSIGGKAIDPAFIEFTRTQQMRNNVYGGGTQ